MKTRDITHVSLSTALIVICSWLSIPTAIPFTLQSCAICLISLLFGRRKSVAATLVYILIGMVGVPVFAGFRGGIGILLGNTGGYIIGFIFTAIIIGTASDLHHGDLLPMIAAMAAGMLVCYICATAWFIFIFTESHGTVQVLSVLSWCVFPYIIPDICKCALAYVLYRRIEPHLRGDTR